LALTCDVWVGDPFGLEWWVAVRGFGARTRGEATGGWVAVRGSGEGCWGKDEGRGNGWVGSGEG
jgi:hypothetical protein